MHYRNGRIAKVGDFAIRRNSDGTLFGGIVAGVSPGTNTCNLSLLTYNRRDLVAGCVFNATAGEQFAVDAEGKASGFFPYLATCQNSSEFLHADDALKAFEKLESALP